MNMKSVNRRGRGWSGTVRKKKTKDQDPAIFVDDWTDVQQQAKEKKGGKCTIM